MHNCLVSPIFQPGRNRFVLTGGSAVAPVKMDVEWEEQGKVRNFSAVADREIVSENIQCEADQPFDIKMRSIALSADR